VVVMLNQMDVAEKKGMHIEPKHLSSLLGVPVVPAIATRGIGITELIEEAVRIAQAESRRIEFKFGDEVEKRIRKLTALLQKYKIPYPPRFLAIRLLEGDAQLEKIVEKIDISIVRAVQILRNEIKEIHHEEAASVIAAERYALSAEITRKVVRKKVVRQSLVEAIDSFATHKVYGYLLLAGVMVGIFTLVFFVGSFIAEFMDGIFESLGEYFYQNFGETDLSKLLWDGIVAGGIGGALSVVIPFVLPFYFLLSLLEDTGYLARAAFLMDAAMHRIGLHGKAFIPMILGYGCNVPACIGCRIMETERERSLAAFLSTLVPCSARTVIILGVVGMFMGIQWAILLYAFNLLIIFGIGKIASRYLPGTGTGLIMDIPDFKRPELKVVLKQTWLRSKDFLIVAMPIIVLGSFAIALLDHFGMLSAINGALAPVVVTWLGLPSVVGFTLIFGVLRKELTLVMLIAFLGTSNLATVLTPLQMLVFTIVVMFYVPCIATIAALVRELGWRKATLITFFEIGFALLLGGIVFHLGLLLTLFF